MKQNKKFIILLLVGLHSAAFLALSPYYFFQEKEIVSFSKRDGDIVLMAVGDIMLDRGVEYKAKHDFKFPFLRISSYLKRADILFGNLESVISDKGKKVGSIYSFRADPKAIEGLSYAGFDVISVANNHVFDYGREAMEDSFKRIREAGILYVGGGFTEQESRQGVVKRVGDTEICFLAYNNQGSPYWASREGISGINWMDKSLKEDIERAEERSDLVVVSFHFGNEYERLPNKTQEEFSRLAIDSGADLVLGHHPHVAQPVERYKEGWIAYSLGNFVFDQYFSEETMEGLLLEVIIKDKKIKEVSPVVFKISEDYQPYF